MIMLYILMGTLWCYSLQATPGPRAHQNYNPNIFSLHTTPTWKEYSTPQRTISFGKEKWAWKSSFTLKSKKPMKLTTLVLAWQGKPLTTLAASLYQKKENAALIPIQKNLIGEGTWDKHKQQLLFTLNEKVVAVNKYHLVISYPKQLESLVKSGKFIIKNTNLSQLAPR